jgi:hypothetical protein
LSPPRPPTTPVRPFGIGRVDLLSLAAPLPSAGASGPAGAVLDPSTTLRGLRESADRFLESDVKTAVSSARLRETSAQWGSVSGGTTGPRSADLVQRTVQDSISPPTSWGGDGWAGLLTALLPVSIAALSPNRALGEAQACLSFLEGYERRVRAFRDGLPTSDEAATPDLIRQWERLSGELSANVSCRPRVSR